MCKRHCLCYCVVWWWGLYDSTLNFFSPHFLAQKKETNLTVTFSAQFSWDLRQVGKGKNVPESECQWVNSWPHLEHTVVDFAGLSCPVSLTISSVPMRPGKCIDSEAKGGRSPEAWTLIDVLVDWKDNIVFDLGVSSQKKNAIAVSCRKHCFSFEGD